jgi:hypothetical protein
LSSLIQILGALPVLAFALAQARVVTPEARSYLVLNVLGGSVLAVDAYTGRQWAFCCWTACGRSSRRGAY